MISGGDMDVRTTINLAPCDRKRLDGAAELAGVTRSALVVMLIGRVLKDHRRLVTCWESVRYQRREPGKKRCRVHVAFNGRDYELCLDSRKLFKRSVSLLVAFAIEHYLDEILQVLQTSGKADGMDNYPFTSYLLTCETIGDSICWRIYWNIPPNPGQIFQN